MSGPTRHRGAEARRMPGEARRRPGIVLHRAAGSSRFRP